MYEKYTLKMLKKVYVGHSCGLNTLGGIKWKMTFAPTRRELRENRTR